MDKDDQKAKIIDLFKTKVKEIRNQTVFNFGQSGIKGAQEIVKILDEK